MTTFRDRPSYCLTRHFLSGLFDLGVLSEAGADSFKRMIIGICAAFLSFGLLLARLFMVKYASLSALATLEPYRHAVLADHAFLIAIPMWIVAFVAVLVGHSLFPDEIDFRVLMALPITRRVIFGTKLLALALFTGLFILAAHAALAPLFALTSMGRWAEHAFLSRAAAYWVASLLASGFAVLAVTALHGLLVMCAPRGRLLAASAALRSVMLCALVLSLPLVGRLPAQASRFGGGAAWLSFAPPAWFLGVERWLLGDTHAHVIRLAQIAAVAVMIAAAVAAGSYAFLYRRFDRVMLRPAEGPSRSHRLFNWTSWGRRDASPPVVVAIRAFVAVTLRRSVLHQGIVVALSAAAAGLVANTLMAAGVPDWLAHGGVPGGQLIGSVIWAPFALMFGVSLAVRAALAVPIEQRANWVFRMTEQSAARADQLDAAAQTVRRFGVIVPGALMFPLQWLVLGRDSIVPLIVALLWGSLLVEILMRDWDRIPFTCSYVPGKGFVPQTILIGGLSFVLFTAIGAGLARLSMTGEPISLGLNAVLGVAVLVLRRFRLRKCHDTPLAFEDQLPTEVNPLRLSTD